MFKEYIQRIKRKYGLIFPIIKILLIVGFVVLLSFFTYKIIFPRVYKQITPKNILNVITKDKVPIKQENDQVNILVLGVGGGNHDGPYLSDSMIVANLNLISKKVAFISIPRDIWIEETKSKINALYSIGENKKQGTGFILSKATVSEKLGIPIQYAVLIDFQAFQSIVDSLNGIDVDVERTFDDYLYPIEGKENDQCDKKEEDLKDVKITDQNVGEIFPCRFEHLHFDKGLQKFTGTQALKFSRSRHASGEEGTDFSRSKRQIKIITAIKNKVTKPEIFLNPSYIIKMSQSLQDDLSTDLNTEQLIYLGKHFINTDLNNVKSLSLDIGTSEKPGLLYNPPVSDYGAYVLMPRNKDWTEIRKRIQSLIEENKPSPTPTKK